MASKLPLTEREADVVLGSGSLKIVGHINWQITNQNVTAQVPVEGEANLSLVMDLHVSVVLPGVYTYQVRQLDGIVLRRLDVRSSHTNKKFTGDNEKWKWRTHKHRYLDACGDAYAYTPTDIPPTTSPAESPGPDEHREVFTAFCEECGIDASGTWVDPPLAWTTTQLGLGGGS